jgi:hypothetical protein
LAILAGKYTQQNSEQKESEHLSELWMMSYELWIMNDELWMMNDEWWIMNDEWWVMNLDQGYNAIQHAIK